MLAERADMSAEPAQPSPGKAGNVAPTLAILRLLAKTDRPLGVNAIARELSLAPSSCFAILKQLQVADFVDFDEQTKNYGLGSGAIMLARRALDPQQAFPIVAPRLQQVVERFPIAIGFWRCLPRSRIVLAGFVEGSSAMRIHMSVGQRLPMLMGAVGRAIAAKLDLATKDLRTAFAHLQWQTPVAFDDYLADISQAQTLGYAVDRGNFAAGVTSVAVAIGAPGGQIRYGVSGIMFASAETEELIAQLGAELTEVADWAAARLIAC